MVAVTPNFKQMENTFIPSLTGYSYLMGGVVKWKISKKHMVADSTCESDCISASETSKESTWLKNFIRDIRVIPTIQEPMELFCDNEGMFA